MEQTLKEKSLQHEGAAVAAAEAQAEPAEVLDERLIGALRAASDKKAVNSLVLDLREVTEFTDFFIITNGTNVRQVQAIADGISEDLKLIDARPIRIEGYNTAEWILMDYGDFVVHIFEEKSREFFDLERLWRDAKRVQIPENL
ncbi:MAG TPA: ribosome silencing factor [Pyrinomonadaceae bacterium]|nr:ribosome silencing factor [Pyrinomonadaceae bacterium]